MASTPSSFAHRDSPDAGGSSWRDLLRASGWNPVVIREGRARWRGARAFWLALGYAGFLAFTLWWSYSSSQRHEDLSGSAMDSIGTAARLGHELFAMLCYCQVGAWLLIAPALTASSLAGEREKGLLEGLLLSHLTPAQIVRGKMASALGLIVLLALAGLPVLAVCFLLGGVSPGEFVGALAIQLATAVCGASIGIASSSLHRRSGAAGSGALGSTMLWMLMTGIALGALGTSTLSGNNTTALSTFLILVAFSNPFLAVAALSSPLASVRGAWDPGLWSVFFESGYGWAISILGMALLSAWKLRQARVVLSRSPEKFDEPPSMARVLASTSTSTCTAPAAPSTEPKLKVREREGLDSTGGSYWQMPILGRIVFGNALMRRELTSSWRWAELSVHAEISLTLGVLALMCLSWLAIGQIFDGRSSAQAMWWGLVMVYGIMGSVVCAVIPATNIMREREAGIWEALRLTLLSPLEVAGAKVGALIVACLGYGSAGWIFLVLAAWRGEIGIGVVLSCMALVLLLWLQVASWSCFSGTRARTSSTAQTWGLGGPLLAWIGLPLLGLMFRVQMFEPGHSSAWQMLHPAMVIDSIVSLAPSGSLGMASRAGEILLGLGVQAGLAALLFGLAWSAVRRSQRAEKSINSRTL